MPFLIEARSNLLLRIKLWQDPLIRHKPQKICEEEHYEDPPEVFHFPMEGLWETYAFRYAFSD